MVRKRAEGGCPQAADAPGHPHDDAGDRARVAGQKRLAHHDVDRQGRQEAGASHEEEENRRKAAGVQEQVESRGGECEARDGDGALPERLGESAAENAAGRAREAEPEEGPSAEDERFAAPLHENRHEGRERGGGRRPEHDDEIEDDQGKQPPLGGGGASLGRAPLGRLGGTGDRPREREGGGETDGQGQPGPSIAEMGHDEGDEDGPCAVAEASAPSEKGHGDAAAAAGDSADEGGALGVEGGGADAAQYQERQQDAVAGGQPEEGHGKAGEDGRGDGDGAPSDPVAEEPEEGL